ncbi:hypothetical protein Kpol_286p1 [Vanderwaltozyma polyspora DSM 70294]|uniref:Uncharacterized protein n=1 Tax=Vanderwaltozyma polyspora (strain ATCC 22028 / DSM 70294 / BCRC 21397 / CBS 2163 / NBRC 10782 / NRRL Y-8283 / UCD 57-17) TaxID=436907 RepID=A7TT95_VANPO|nr:uncharacterized protein Kpol_286p1 [Vanderwaltozyma polyspora DSM 70294]EDO14508.1 hypothetical protein Kpol_286p1 [Vanderwaltozyma polyspora DSM 70294]
MIENKLADLDLGSSDNYCKLDKNLEMLAKDSSSKKFIDVTDVFKKLGSKLNPDVIIKSPNFDLFEGTRSLEVSNPKLDSSLIQLSKEEIDFNCDLICGNDNFIEQLQNVTAISDRLLRSIICWLNEYQTLPTTVLSCRYVEHILKLSAINKKMTSLQTGNDLYDRVLSSMVFGVCYFGKFVQQLLVAGVILEEEDLNFNGMNLDFFSYIESSDEVLKLIDDGIAYLNSVKSGGVDFLLHILEIVKSLVRIEETITKYSTETDYLDYLIKHSEILNDLGPYSHEPPLGSFSMGIQKRMENQFPPKSLVIPSHNYLGLKVMANDVKKVLSVAECRTALETLQFARFFNHLTQKHVISRAIFSLFFIRDDQTILGKYSLDEFMDMHLNEVTMAGTNSSRLCLDGDSYLLLEPVYQEAIRVALDYYQNKAQNTCRVRQGYNRHLILWDSLQAQMENVEIELESIGIVNKADEEQESTFLPYSSWIYVNKVTIMLDFILKGFDLGVYKPFEAFAMYWYGYYLTHKQEFCLKTILQFLDSRINSIHAINKRVKKQKSAEKKEALRAKYKHAMSNEMPQLQTNKRYINYLLLKSSIEKSLCLVQVFQFAILKSYGIIDYKTPSESTFINDELIHDLRMKPFSSIGVPELPTYKEFNNALQDFSIQEPMFSSKLNKSMEYMKKELSSVAEAVEQIKKCISTGDNNGSIVTGTRLVKEESFQVYEQLGNTTKALQVNSEIIRKKLGEKPQSNLIEKYLVDTTFPPNASTFFPLFSLVNIQPSKN